MISEEQKNEIVTMWKKGSNISKIHRVTGVSRPTVRKVVKQYDANRKWWLTRTRNEDGLKRFVINTWRQRAGEEGTAVERLQAGVLHYELHTLLRSFIKPKTADEIWTCFGKDPPGICVLHLKESELIPGVTI